MQRIHFKITRKTQEIAFQGFPISKFSRGVCSRAPLDSSRLRREIVPPPSFNALAPPPDSLTTCVVMEIARAVKGVPMVHRAHLRINKTPAQAFTPPADEKKMGTIWIFVYYAVYGSGRGRCRDFLVLKLGGLNLQIWD